MVRSGVYTVSTDHNRPGHGYQDSRQGYYTEVVDITKIVKIPRLSSRVLFLTREGRDGGNDLLYEQVLYLFEGTYSVYFIGIPEESC